MSATTCENATRIVSQPASKTSSTKTREEKLVKKPCKHLIQDLTLVVMVETDKVTKKVSDLAKSSVSDRVCRHCALNCLRRTTQ